jgi:uncharacterized protein (DUF488 family)
MTGRDALTIATIGHSTRELDAVVSILRGHGITRLIDVRTVPRSRHNPQFNRETLPGSLAASGIGYLHMPGLGGLRHPRRDSVNTGWRNSGFRGYADYMQTGEFARALDALLGQARVERVAIMCAEAVPWRCHRSLVADALTVRGLRVVHLLGPERAEPHVLTGFARVDGTTVTYPAAPGPSAQGELPLGGVDAPAPGRAPTCSSPRS